MDRRAGDEARVPHHALLMRAAPGDSAQDAVEPQSLQAEGATHGDDMFEAGTVNRMFVVEMVATLGAGRRLSDDEITDLIEAVVDDLDRLSLEPSVGTSRQGDDVDVTVAVTVSEAQELEALTLGVSAIKAAFHAAGIGTAGMIAPRDLRSRVLPLQSA